MKTLCTIYFLMTAWLILWPKGRARLGAVLLIVALCGCGKAQQSHAAVARTGSISELARSSMAAAAFVPPPKLVTNKVAISDLFGGWTGPIHVYGTSNLSDPAAVMHWRGNQPVVAVIVRNAKSNWWFRIGAIGADGEESAPTAWVQYPYQYRFLTYIVPQPALLQKSNNPDGPWTDWTNCASFVRVTIPNQPMGFVRGPGVTMVKE